MAKTQNPVRSGFQVDKFFEGKELYLLRNQSKGKGLGPYSPVQAAFFSTKVLPEKIGKIIFSNLNPLIIENPA